MKNLAALLTGSLLLVVVGPCVASAHKIRTAQSATCLYEGKPYSPGSQRCEAGRLCVCQAGGTWHCSGKC